MHKDHMAVLLRRMIQFEKGQVSADEVERMREAQDRGKAFTQFGSIAVIPILGPIFHRGDAFSEFFGIKSSQSIVRSMKEAVSNPDITSIVLDVDSPGGEVDGTPEAAAEMLALRGSKPIIAVSNTMMASAAYWLSVAADQIVASTSSISGSVGVWTMHVDESKFLEQIGLDITLIFAGEHKVDGNPFEPLSEEVHADLQKEMDDIHADFIRGVAKGRGLTPNRVRNTFGDGRTFSAAEAVELGVADRVGTLNQELARLSGGSARGRRSMVTVPAEALESARTFDLSLANIAKRTAEDEWEGRQLQAERDRLIALGVNAADLDEVEVEPEAPEHVGVDWARTNDETVVSVAITAECGSVVVMLADDLRAAYVNWNFDKGGLVVHGVELSHELACRILDTTQPFTFVGELFNIVALGDQTLSVNRISMALIETKENPMRILGFEGEVTISRRTAVDVVKAAARGQHEALSRSGAPGDTPDDPNAASTLSEANRKEQHRQILRLTELSCR